MASARGLDPTNPHPTQPTTARPTAKMAAITLLFIRSFLLPVPGSSWLWGDGGWCGDGSHGSAPLPANRQGAPAAPATRPAAAPASPAQRQTASRPAAPSAAAHHLALQPPAAAGGLRANAPSAAPDGRVATPTAFAHAHPASGPSPHPAGPADAGPRGPSTSSAESTRARQPVWHPSAFVAPDNAPRGLQSAHIPRPPPQRSDSRGLAGLQSMQRPAELDRIHGTKPLAELLRHILARRSTLWLRPLLEQKHKSGAVESVGLVHQSEASMAPAPPKGGGRQGAGPRNGQSPLFSQERCRPSPTSLCVAGVTSKADCKNRPKNSQGAASFSRTEPPHTRRFLTADKSGTGLAWSNLRLFPLTGTRRPARLRSPCPTRLHPTPLPCQTLRKWPLLWWCRTRSRKMLWPSSPACCSFP